jgi:hypothetical protein
MFAAQFCLSLVPVLPSLAQQYCNYDLCPKRSKTSMPMQVA